MWRDLTQIMQLLLGTEKKCDKVEVRYHLNIQQRVQEQTGKINLARVTLSDLENDSDDNETSVFYFLFIFYNILLSTILSFPQLFMHSFISFSSFSKVHSLKKNNAMKTIFR